MIIGCWASTWWCHITQPWGAGHLGLQEVVSGQRPQDEQASVGWGRRNHLNKAPEATESILDLETRIFF